MSYSLIKRGEGIDTVRLKGLEIRVLAKTDRFSAKIMILEPGASTGGLYTHEGNEFHWVLEGKLVMTLGEEKIIVEKGDAIQYSSQVPHAWDNGNERTEILTINSPPYVYAPR